jgi:AraC-like DNA-binding protein
MIFVVCLDSGEKLEFLDALSPELTHYRTLPLVYTAAGRWGTAIFQALLTDDFCMLHAVYLIKERVCLHVRSDMETRQLHLAYRNNIDMEPVGWGRIQLKEEQFNLSYFPTLDIKLRFEPGEYTGFDISFSEPYLRRFEPHVDGLRDFLQGEPKGNGRHLSPAHLYASPPMLTHVKQILEVRHRDALSLIYIESEVLGLLTLAIQAMGNEMKQPVRPTSADRALMGLVRDWLLENLYDPLSLHAIARHFAINEYKLKRDFKAVFGTTVFDFLQHTRLMRAEQLLKETDKSIAEIAWTVGYSTGAHFSEAFKKRFGYPPNYVRKNKRS